MKFITVFFFLLAAAVCGGSALAQPPAAGGFDPETPSFREVIEKKLISYDVELCRICPIDTNLAARRVFYDYGAIFVSDNGGKLPAKCIFENEEEVEQFQTGVDARTETVGGVRITLQKPAMEALLRARREARQQGLTITPRGGSIAAARSFEDTLRLWNSRFYPALKYWVRKKKLTSREAARARELPLAEQVAQVLEWENRGLYFSTGFNKSILYSVAAPGASQHIFMLALDVRQFGDRRVRQILARHGWFQTVISDRPHFTYLGRPESELPALGLRAVNSGGHRYWVPNQE